MTMLLAFQTPGEEAVKPSTRWVAGHAYTEAGPAWSHDPRLSASERNEARATRTPAPRWLRDLAVRATFASIGAVLGVAVVLAVTEVALPPLATVIEAAQAVPAPAAVSAVAVARRS